MRAFERCRRTIPRALTALAGGNGALGLLDVCRPVFLLPGKLKVPVAFLAGVGTVLPGGDFVVLSHAISLQAGSGTGRYAARRRQCNHPQGARKRGSAGCHMTRPDRSRAGFVPVRIRATPASCGSAMGATSAPELPRGDRPVRFARKGGAPIASSRCSLGRATTVWTHAGRASLRQGGAEAPPCAPAALVDSEPEPGAGGHHRRAAGAHGVDDFLGSDRLGIEARERRHLLLTPAASTPPHTV
jgi:hypothetical protein